MRAWPDVGSSARPDVCSSSHCSSSFSSTTTPFELRIIHTTMTMQRTQHEDSPVFVHRRTTPSATVDSIRQYYAVHKSGPFRPTVIMIHDQPCW
jgi:hypothetical protein